MALCFHVFLSKILKSFQGNVPYLICFSNFLFSFFILSSLDMAPYVWVESGRVTGQPNRREGVTRKEDRYGWYREGQVGDDFFIDQALPHLVGEACEFIAERAEAARGGEPFFLYLPHSMPHIPLYVPDEVRTHDLLDIPDTAKKKLMQTNAERVFGFEASR